MTPRIPLEEVERRLLKKHKGKIKMFNYFSVNSYADFECNNHHTWSAKVGDVVNGGKGCRKCYNVKVSARCRTKEEEVLQKIFSRHGESLTMLKYGGSAASTKSLFRCNVCGYEWETIAKNIYRETGCKKCGIVRRGIRHRGSKSNFWKGGITVLRPYVKGILDKWKEDSMKSCDYRCIITGSKNFEIHHLYPLNKIINDSLNELGLEKNNFIGDYSENEFRPILNKILELHYRHPLGVCLRKDIHVLFHKKYGRENCTPQDFLDFHEQIKNGKIVIKKQKTKENSKNEN